MAKVINPISTGRLLWEFRGTKIIFHCEDWFDHLKCGTPQASVLCNLSFPLLPPIFSFRCLISSHGFYYYVRWQLVLNRPLPLWLPSICNSNAQWDTSDFIRPSLSSACLYFLHSRVSSFLHFPFPHLPLCVLHLLSSPSLSTFLQHQGLKLDRLNSYTLLLLSFYPTDTCWGPSISNLD